MQQDDAAIRRLAAEHGLQEARVGCVYCGNQDLKKMKILEPEGEEAMRLDVCEYCPVCGRQPVMAVLRKEQHGRVRFLVCDGCHTVWPYARVGCVYCGNQDLKKMKILEPEGEEAMRLDVCETARSADASL